MPSKSKAQQKFFGIVRSIQKGEAPKSKFSKSAQDAAKDMKKSDVKKYAKTKHKGLPNKVKQETKVQSLIRKMVREIIDEGKLTEGGKEIAKTILQQLGGNKFIAMTGAKNLGFTDKGIQMKIGRNAKGVTHVIIDLDRGKDLYNIEFVKVRGMKRTTVKKLKGIYADQLKKIFTQNTGLRVSL